jgi:hypothetical protein
MRNYMSGKNLCSLFCCIREKGYIFIKFLHFFLKNNNAHRSGRATKNPLCAQS